MNGRRMRAGQMLGVIALLLIPLIGVRAQDAGDYAPNPACPTSNYWEAVTPTILAFKDTLAIALATPRAGLAPLLVELRRLYREMEATPADSCAVTVRELLLTRDGLAMGRFTCLAYIDVINTDSLATTAVSALLGSTIGMNAGVEVDLEDATFLVTDRGSNQATVVMGGELIVATADAFQRLDSVATFQLSIENNRWRVCSFNPGSGAAGAAVTRNADWTPVDRIFEDGVPMVEVPAGCFMMGSADGFQDSVQPVHQQCFDTPFWIDRTEVTQADFQRLGGSKAEQSFFSAPDHPVETITWFEARDFCALRGARLPTEAEWEYAASGPDSLAYPWGSGWDEDNAVWEGNANIQTAAVGSRLTGRSWVGADDMSGNVWEWTSSLYEPYPYVARDGREMDTGERTDVMRAFRGGAWNVGIADILRAAYRSRNFVDARSNDVGVRCARSSEVSAASVTPTSVSLADALVAGSAFSGGNADWQEQHSDGLLHRFEDGVAMVLVPAGCFMMGSADAIQDSAQPVQRQCFSAPFWIDLTEVTQADFQRLNGLQAEPSFFSGPDRPVDSITWFEARDFCALRGARLPTEAEWEYAARGPDGLAYPWGNDWNADHAVWEGNASIRTAAVGTRPDGRSWVGAEDMTGNVWEWTSSVYAPYPYDAKDGREMDTGERTDVLRTFRGGAWNVGIADILRAAYRSRNSVDARSNDVGVRCARSS